MYPQTKSASAIQYKSIVCMAMKNLWMYENFVDGGTVLTTFQSLIITKLLYPTWCVCVCVCGGGGGGGVEGGGCPQLYACQDKMPKLKRKTLRKAIQIKVLEPTSSGSLDILLRRKNKNSCVSPNMLKKQVFC